MTAARGEQDGLEEAQQQVAHLTVALESSRTIGAAMGLLMAKYQIGRAAAFDVLRRQSQKSNVKVAVLADQLLQDFERGC